MGARITGTDKPKRKCPLCKGKKVLPWKVAKELPKPGRNIKCTRCDGKGEI